MKRYDPKKQGKVIEGFYCPACGEFGTIRPIDLSPGMGCLIVCPNCKKKWDIRIKYRETISKSYAGLKNE